MDRSIAHEPDTTSKKDIDYRTRLEEYFESSVGTITEKLENFPKYVQQTTLNRFLARYEIFKHTINVPGAIIECGVLFGGGLMTFAHLSSIMDPWAVSRRIIGFDTFSGFRDLSEVDKGPGRSMHATEGGFGVDAYEDLQNCINIFDRHRLLGHLPKVELVRGDIRETVPKYIEDNPHLVVSLLFLDVDVYEPTKVAIEHFLPRMPKGAVVAFDELYARHWPGETKALVDTIGINALRLKRPFFSTWMSYAVIE
ncbi:MAG: TylF/MycF/NovP-related O-methyltransferase [Bacillota bacterium]